MVSRIRSFVLPLLVLALVGAACSKAPGRNDSTSTLSHPVRVLTIIFMTDFAQP